MELKDLTTITGLSPNDEILVVRSSIGPKTIVPSSTATSADDIVKKALQKAYPVGSYIESDNDPSSTIGGSWTNVKRSLWAIADGETSGSTGGAATVSLTTTALPSHRHVHGGADYGCQFDVTDHNHGSVTFSHSHTGSTSHTHRSFNTNHTHSVNSHTHDVAAHVHTYKGFKASVNEAAGYSAAWTTTGNVGFQGRVVGSEKSNPAGSYLSGVLGANTSTLSGTKYTGYSSYSAYTNSYAPTSNTLADWNGGTNYSQSYPCIRNQYCEALSVGNICDAVGSGTAHENRPPTIVTRIWRRTA